MTEDRHLVSIIHAGQVLIALILLLTTSLVAAIQDLAQDGPISQDPLDPVMNVIQIAPSITIPTDAKWRCTKDLMNHTFAYSYGKPFIGELILKYK